MLPSISCERGRKVLQLQFCAPVHLEEGTGLASGLNQLTTTTRLSCERPQPVSEEWHCDSEINPKQATHRKKEQFLPKSLLLVYIVYII